MSWSDLCENVQRKAEDDLWLAERREQDDYDPFDEDSNRERRREANAARLWADQARRRYANQPRQELDASQMYVKAKSRQLYGGSYREMGQRFFIDCKYFNAELMERVSVDGKPLRPEPQPKHGKDGSVTEPIDSIANTEVI